jgi:MinD-like ATPase involved in chromosome partitioning or flagellar assembly
MLAVLGAARSSPGVTTAALLLAGCLEGAMLIEADPDGGVLQARFGLDREPNLATFAAASRNGTFAHLEAHALTLPGGLPALTGPASAEAAVATWQAAGTTLAAALRAAAGQRTVVVDAGRLTPTAPTSALLDVADLVIVVARPVLEDLHALAHRRDTLAGSQRPVQLLVVGERPYGADEIRERLGMPVLGVLPHDPRAAGALSGSSTPLSTRWLRRSPLARSARDIAGRLGEALAVTDADVEAPA